MARPAARKKYIDITETPEAKALEAISDERYSEYLIAAAITTAAWKAAGRPREGGYFDPKSKAYNDYQNSLEDKQEAYNRWQRAAANHGHYIIPQAEDA